LFNKSDFERNRDLGLFDKVFEKVVKVIDGNVKLDIFIVNELLIFHFDFRKIENIGRLQVENNIVL